MLNPKKLLLIALIWFCKSTSLPKLDYFFCTPKTKSTSQARIRPEIFFNFRLEPGPNPTRKAWHDLLLCHIFYDIFVSQKVPFSKISDDAIACHFWFGPPPNQKPYAYARGKGIFGPCPPPQTTACASQARVNFCTSTR